VNSRQRVLTALEHREPDRVPVDIGSCGSVYYAVRDLVEIGVDILNPIQVGAKDMDTARLKREFGDRLSFWGAIDTQQVLPFGTPQQVRDQVRERIDIFSQGGGFIFCSIHNVQPGTPIENLLAMFDAVREYR
jgi:uroporphyrinogen decarboxylase